MNFPAFRQFVWIISGSLLLSVTGFTQTTSTDPVGFYKITCSGSSDTIVSMPFTRAPEFVGSITGVSGSGGNVLTVSGSTGWAANQFVYLSGTAQTKHYYAVVGTQFTALNGTVSMTQGTATLTGVGTNFSTAGVVPGNGLMVGAAYFIVKSVDSETQITATIPARNTGSALTASVSKSPREGSIYDITANDATSVTVNLNGDSLSSLQAGTQLTLIPHWSLATVFPASDAGVSFIPSPDALSRKTEIFIPNYGGSGVNLSAAKSYFFTNGAWRLGNDVSEDHGNDVLLPGAYFQVRNNDVGTVLTTVGTVACKRKLALPVATQTGTRQDNLLAVTRPVDVTLKQSGLFESGAFAVSASAFLRGDELYIFDNSQIGFNKSASSIYFYYNGAWRKGGQDISVDAGSDVIPAGSGFVVRKATTPDGATKFWQNAPTYD